jgi:hypothetical protein
LRNVAKIILEQKSSDTHKKNRFFSYKPNAYAMIYFLGYSLSWSQNCEYWKCAKAILESTIKKCGTNLCNAVHHPLRSLCMLSNEYNPFVTPFLIAVTVFQHHIQISLNSNLLHPKVSGEKIAKLSKKGFSFSLSFLLCYWTFCCPLNGI